MARGEIEVLIVQTPYLEGQLAVQYAYDAVTGKGRVRRSAVLSNVTATRSHMKNSAIKKWFYVNSAQ